MRTARFARLGALGGAASAGIVAHWWIRGSPVVWAASSAAPPDLCASCLDKSLATFFKEQTDRRLVAEHVNRRHTGGWTPLMVAAAHGDVDGVRLLLQNGADVSAADHYQHDRRASQDILHHRYDMFPRLRVTSQTEGCTALHYGVISGNTEVVELLLSSGSNPTVTDKRGRVPGAFVEILPQLERKPMQKALEGADGKWASFQKEQRRAFPLEKRLQERLVGQTQAIDAVGSAVRRKENGWHDPDHPLVFLFLGSSGIGKTELAKQVAEYLHPGKKDGFIRVDMSEYQSQHEVAKFLGAPPGYVGHQEGGQLTNKLEKCPNAVVLLDEVEKAHPDVLTALLQVFDEGRLTDGKGKTIACKDAVFVMTSNLAQQPIADEALRIRKESGQDDVPLSAEFKQTTVQPILKRSFGRDEFLGRITETLFFLPFTDDQLRSLAGKELKRWADIAQRRHKVQLTWTRAVEDLVIRAYNVRYGARSLQHEVERAVISQLAMAQEADEIKTGSQVKVDAKNDNVTLDIGTGKGGWRLFGN